MSRAGEEMMLELATMLETMEKTAGKKKGPGVPDGTGPNPECPLKEEKKDEKEEKEDKGEGKKKRKRKGKAKAFVHTINELVKLADTLDDLGNVEASDLVDETIKIIIASIKTAQPTLEYPEEEDITESFEEEEPVTGREEGTGTRMERTLQEPEEKEMAQPRQEDTPEGLGMEDFGESGTMEDKMDKILSDPEAVEFLKEKGLL